jgi:hypothetical protein
LRQWHPTKNGKLVPEELSAFTNRRVWWKCAAAPDHEWLASIQPRSKRGVGCPFCAGSRASAANSLAARKPELAKEWDQKKNGKLRPSDVTEGANRKV